MRKNLNLKLNRLRMHYEHNQFGQTFSKKMNALSSSFSFQLVNSGLRCNSLRNTTFCQASFPPIRCLGRSSQASYLVCATLDSCAFNFKEKSKSYYLIGNLDNSKKRMKPLNFFKFNFGNSSLPEIVQAGDPVLHEMADEVPLEQINTPEIQSIIDQMIEVMRSAPGVGLAAPQIGLPLQIIVLEDTEELMSYCPKEEVIEQERKAFGLMVIINPQLQIIGNKTAKFFEGCLSVNGYRALVERSLEVEVNGHDRTGKSIKVNATGWQARILQHECDHLNGTLYVERMIGKSFRNSQNLRLPLPSACPKPGKVELQ